MYMRQLFSVTNKTSQPNMVDKYTDDKWLTNFFLISYIASVLAELLQSSNSALEKKRCNFCFYVLQGSVEALIRWDGKSNQLLVAYSHAQISAKNYQPCLMYL